MAKLLRKRREEERCAHAPMHEVKSERERERDEESKRRGRSTVKTAQGTGWS